MLPTVRSFRVTGLRYVGATEAVVTKHEVLKSLLLLVAWGYGLYLAWFLARTVREHRARRITRSMDR